MTENSKIFLTKNAIYNLLSLQLFSIGLSLYIIKDIEQQLEKGYNDILNQELQDQLNNIPDQKTYQQLVDLQQELELQVIDLSNSGVYPVKWIPDNLEENKDIEDLAN